MFPPTNLILASAGGTQGGPGQTLQLQHSGRQLEGPGRRQAERSHSSLPDLHSTQEHGETSCNCVTVYQTVQCAPILYCSPDIVQEGVHQYYSQPLRFNTGNPDVTSYNVTGLQPDTKYKIQV